VNALERAALDHIAAQLAYQRSHGAVMDRLLDIARRAAADRKAGHTPACSLTKCAPDCPSGGTK